MSEEPKERTPRDPAPRQVLDPAWEDELRAGQEQDGGAGSVDEELAALHLLRHLREPEMLDAGELDTIWRSIEPQLQPKPWWQRAWFFVGAPALASGAALLLVLATPSPEGSEGPQVADASTPASSELTATPAFSPSPSPSSPSPSPSPSLDAALTASASALVLEQNFAALEPSARRRLAGRVDHHRAQARGDLLARAQGSRS